MKKSIFKVGSKEIGPVNLFFIIEEGQANLGNYNRALSMIDAAVTTGAEAIEFQLARVGDFYVKDDPGYKIYKEREFSDSQLNDLISYTKRKGLEFIAVPLSHKLVGPLAKAGCSAFNINASDLTNPDIIDAVIDSGLPFFLSLPLAREEEIDWAVNRIMKKNARIFALLHGQHTMASGENGVDVEHTSLGYITTLKKRYQVPVGFIDHTPFTWMPAAAVSAGAEIVSKHLTISRSEKGPDWHICLEPDEMKEAVIWAKQMRDSVITNYKKLAPGENMDRVAMRRSIVASKVIAAGRAIGREDIEFKRPGTGLDPSRHEEILGRVVSREIKADEQIKLPDLKEK